MAVERQVVKGSYAIYEGDCVEVIQRLKNESVHLSIYSPPFAGLYHYSSSERDMSNCRSYEEFMNHYRYLAKEIERVTKPGRISAVHCTDVPSGNTGRDYMIDFPGDIIRMHAELGFRYVARYVVWKDPFVVYLRTLQKSLRHRTCVEDSSRCSAAAADYLLMFRKDGANEEPIEHPTGLHSYAGSKEVPKDLLKFRGYDGKQTENRYSQWVWRQYASAFWDDVRLERVLPFRDSKDPDDEKHVHPLQLDVIERAVTLWSNPGDVVLTPFMGVGSEVYGAVSLGRKGLGVELKPSYFRQAKMNLEALERGEPEARIQTSMFAESNKEWSDVMAEGDIDV